MWPFKKSRKTTLTDAREKAADHPIETPAGVYCRASVISGYEQEAEFCRSVLVATGLDYKKRIVVLRCGERVYVQGNFPLLSDSDSESEFKALWPLWWYVYDHFFRLMVENRGAEAVFFVQRDLMEELANFPEHLDFVELFHFVSILPQQIPGRLSADDNSAVHA